MNIQRISTLILSAVAFGFVQTAAAQNIPLVAIGPIDAAAQNISCDGWDSLNVGTD